MALSKAWEAWNAEEVVSGRGVPSPVRGMEHSPRQIFEFNNKSVFWCIWQAENEKFYSTVDQLLGGHISNKIIEEAHTLPPQVYACVYKDLPKKIL